MTLLYLLQKLVVSRSFWCFYLLFSITISAQKWQNHTRVQTSKSGVVQLVLNKKVVPPFAYMSYLGEGKYYQEVADTGVNIFCLLTYFGDQGINSNSGIKPFRPTFWVGENAYNYNVVEQEFEDLVAKVPDAKVIVRVHLDAPIWWQEKNPTEVCRLQDGSDWRVSFSSDKWRKDAGNALTELLNWLQKSKYNKNLIGIHVAGGFTEEWFYHYPGLFFDGSVARKNDIHKWLRVKYSDNLVDFRKAWKNDTVRFETAQLTAISGEKASKSWHTASDDFHRNDSFEYHTSVMARNISYFANLVKKQCDNRLLVGAFYGYHLFVTDARRGHGTLGELLKEPALDYLSSPNDYRREAGIDWMPMAAVKSVQMHGKLWLAENDTRTVLTTLLKDRAPHVNPPNNAYEAPVWHGPKDMASSVGNLWKNTARMLQHGYGGWWFDMWGGWFSSPELMKVISETNRLYNNSFKKGAYQPEIALIVDEKLFTKDNSFGSLTAEILANRYSLGNIGTSFDIILRSDLSRVHSYKAVWLLGCENLNQEEKAHVDRLRKLGTTVKTTSAYNYKGLETLSQLREWAIKAGVHIFSSADDVVYAGNGWLAIHCKEGGSRTIHLPDNWKLTSVIDNSKVVVKNKSFDIAAEAGATYLYKIH